MKPITEQTIQELKALAYDQLATIEACQNNLKLINAEITKRNTPTIEPVVEETK